MKADAECRCGAAEDAGCIPGFELLPGDQGEYLAVALAQVLERSTDRLALTDQVGGVVTPYGCVDRAEALDQRPLPAPTPSLVREHLSGYAEEPWPDRLGDVGAPTPGNGERLGHNVVCGFDALGSAPGEGQDR